MYNDRSVASPSNDHGGVCALRRIFTLSWLVHPSSTSMLYFTFSIPCSMGSTSSSDKTPESLSDFYLEAK
jgi:hypothetical protein